jgi:hypothetical protein
MQHKSDPYIRIVFLPKQLTKKLEETAAINRTILEINEIIFLSAKSLIDSPKIYPLYIITALIPDHY